MIKMLIANNASANEIDRDGHTALDAAADATRGKLKKKKKKPPIYSHAASSKHR